MYFYRLLTRHEESMLLRTAACAVTGGKALLHPGRIYRFMVLSSAICVIQTQHLGSYLTDYCGTGEVTAPNFWLTIQRSFERMNWGSGGWDGGTKRHIIWCLRLRNCWRATTLCSRRIMSKGGKWSTHRCLRLTQTPQIYSTLTQIISWSIPCSGCSLHSHCSPKLSQFLLCHANVPESLAYR